MWPNPRFIVIDKALSMADTVCSTRSLFKLIGNYWEKGIFRTLPMSQGIVHWKNDYSFNYFCKTLHLKSFRRFWIYVSFLNISGFWVFLECKYARVLNFQGYTGLTYFCKYVRVLNIPGLFHAQASEFPGLQRFVYFRKYDTVLNMHWDAIKEGFWIL